MSISSSSLNLSTSNLFRALPTPLANTAEISMGAFRVPSATALYTSNTSFGTNANAALGGTYISSAAILETNMAQAKNIISSANVINTSNILESGTGLKNALAAIAKQTPGSKFQSFEGVFNTKEAPSIIDSGLHNKQTSQISTQTNIQTSSPVFTDKIALTGRNANMGSENALNYAAVKANYNVTISPAGTTAIQQLNNVAAQQFLNNTTFAQIISQNMPMVPAMPGDISAQTPTSFAGNNIIDTLAQTFNNIMSGGGHGGGTGGNLSEQLAQSQDKSRKKAVNFIG